MINTARKFRLSLIAAALLCSFVTGCGDKPEETNASQPAPNAAAQTGSAPVQGKVSTGADPDKAPSYPNMYGKPAGAQ